MSHNYIYQQSADSRILIISLRQIQNFAFNACLYEFEDIISQIDRVDLLCPGKLSLLGKAIKNAFKYQSKLVPAFAQIDQINPYLEDLEINKEYDLIFFILDFPWDFISINLIKKWQEKCKVSICYVVEVWEQKIPQYENALKFFNNFDFVFLGHSHVVEPASKIINKPCQYLAPGIDTIKFFPNRKYRDRSIDITSLGRRSTITHNALLNLAEEDNFFYNYDPFVGGLIRNRHHQHHRTLIANFLKNSRYYITNYAQINSPGKTGGKMEIGYRFFEGAAAGTVMIGTPPKTPDFDKYFGWKDSVIEMDFDQPNMRDFLAELEAQPARLASISCNNVTHALLQHDWLYRWQEVLVKAGLSPTEKMESRQSQLQQLAKSMELVAS